MAEMALPLNPDLPIDDVLEVLQRGEMSPSELIQALASRNISDADVRTTIWYLISQNQLELSDNQRLRLAAA